MPMMRSINSTWRKRDMSSMAGVFLLSAVVVSVLGIHAVASL